jgi:two-component system sensor histidine kinase AtoS
VYQWEFQNTVNGRWYDIRDRVIQWVDGTLVRMEIATDITERKEIEETLKRAEQMKLVGEWAAGLAHEIKNSLAGIKISVEVLIEEPNILEEDRASIHKAIDEIKRIELLLRSLLTFARPPELELLATNVNEILDNSISFSLMQSSLSPNIIEKINVLKDFDSNLTNILINAREAMQESGTLAVKTSYDSGTDTIQVEIYDTGEGIDEKVINKIFRPFFTTKSKGTGLGLAITKRIVEQHGGDICGENRPGGGAVFHINLPVNQVKKEQIT